MWRPKDWHNVFKGLPPHQSNAGEGVFETIYEAGADAMLEALIAKGTIYKGIGEEGALFTIPSGTGWLVFIPKEEE